MSCLVFWFARLCACPLARPTPDRSPTSRTLTPGSHGRAMSEAIRLVSDDAVEAFSVAGTPTACRDRLEAFIDAGITEPILMIQGDGPERDAALAFLREL